MLSAIAHMGFLPRRAWMVAVLEGTCDFAAGRVVDLQDGVNVAVGHCRLELRREAVVAEEVAGVGHVEPGAVHERPAGEQHSHAVLHAVAVLAGLAATRGEQLGGQRGLGWVVELRTEEALAEAGDNGVKLLRVNEKRRVKDLRRETGIVHLDGSCGLVVSPGGRSAALPSAAAAAPAFGTGNMSSRLRRSCSAFLVS